MGMDEGGSTGERPQRPATRVREPSPIDEQRQPVTARRAVSAWSTACLAGLLGLVTAALWRDARRAELVSMVGDDVPAEQRDEAILLLVGGTFVVMALLLLVAALLTARLSRGGVATRLLLTLVVIVQALLVPLIIPVLVAAEWEGLVTTGLITLQVLLGVVGTVLMWLPGSRSR